MKITYCLYQSNNPHPEACLAADMGGAIEGVTNQH